MLSFDVSTLSDAQRPTGVWTASLLHALARDEVAGRRRPRLTEPKLDTWARFRGRLSSVDLVSLLFEDAAVLHRVPFDPEAVGGSLRPSRLPESVTDGWLDGPPNEGQVWRRAAREAREVSKRLASAARGAHLVIGEEYGV